MKTQNIYYEFEFPKDKKLIEERDTMKKHQRRIFYNMIDY